MIQHLQRSTRETPRLKCLEITRSWPVLRNERQLASISGFLCCESPERPPPHSTAAQDVEIVSKFSKTVLDRRKAHPIACGVSVLTHVQRMKIKAYLKPQCGWSNGVRAILRKHNLPFEDIDIINNRANYAEMVQKSGQPLSPCVEVDGVMLADVSGEEVENYLLSNDLVKPSESATNVATNAGCSDEEHAKMATKTIRFF